VRGLDRDAEVIEGLRRDAPPLYEPGLAERLAQGRAAGRLSFTTEPDEALTGAEIVLLTFDTPVDDQDEADVAWVLRQLDTAMDAVAPGTIVVVSAQVPVGFTRSLERRWSGRGLRFACSPENLRLGRALETFERQERVVVGVRDESVKDPLALLLGPFAGRIEWMSVESAEMTKHALNAFLATSVSFINEMARLCEAVGADAKEVERGLKSEPRIGPRAYLGPGAPFAGGTLARDVRFLMALGRGNGLATPLFSGVIESNDAHARWIQATVERLLAGLVGPVAAVLGLTYTPGTSTLRRSSALELCRWLVARDVAVRAHDPAVHTLPDAWGCRVHLCEDAREALRGADVAIVATTWPQYRDLTPADFVAAMRRPVVVDQNWFLGPILIADARVRYVAPGRYPVS
jgi:UDPglucose 6-dehydrogenase